MFKSITENGSAFRDFCSVKYLIVLGYYMKLSKLFLYIILIFTFVSMGACFAYFGIADKEYSFIVPSVIGFIFATIFLCLLIEEAFIGRKEYSFDADKIFIKRKGKTIDVIKKETIEELVLVYDCIKDTLHHLIFKCNSKKHRIVISKASEKNVYEFIKDLKYKKGKTVGYI